MMDDLLGIAVRISISYVFILCLLRLAGKRSIGELTSLDFVVTLIIGDLFDDIFWAEVPLSQGFTAISTIILLHTLLSYFECRYVSIHKLVTSPQTLMVKMGNFVQAGIIKERLPEDEIMADLRISQVEELAEVREASLEPSGRLSVFKVDEAKPAQKKDLPLLKEMFQ
jgi:uncharacterized membrane protein YcaP (DUF421 family)